MNTITPRQLEGGELQRSKRFYHQKKFKIFWQILWMLIRVTASLIIYVPVTRILSIYYKYKNFKRL